REGGAVTIDITKASILREGKYEVPTKKEAMEDFIKSYGYSPEEGVYFGNETSSIDSRDGIVAKIKGLRVYAVDKNQHLVIPQAVPIGVGIEATYRKLKEIADNFQNIKFIGMDMDGTILGVKPDKTPETLDDRKDMLDVLIKLIQKGIHLAVFTDNASKVVIERVLEPLNREIKNRGIEIRDDFMSLYACGMVIKIKVKADGSKEYEKEYSQNKVIPKEIREKIIEKIGDKVKIVNDEIVSENLLSKFYNEILFKGKDNKLQKVKAEGYAYYRLNEQDKYPDFHLRGIIVQKRDENVLGDGSLAQFSILPIPSRFTKGCKIRNTEIDKRDELLIRIINALIEINASIKNTSSSIINSTLREYYAGSGRIKDKKDFLENRGFVRKMMIETALNKISKKVENERYRLGNVNGFLTMEEVEAEAFGVKSAEEDSEEVFNKNLLYLKLAEEYFKLYLTKKIIDQSLLRKAIYAAILSDNITLNMLSDIENSKKALESWVEFMLGMEEEVKIDDTHDFYNDIIKTKKYIHIVGSNGELAFDLFVFGVLILNIWMQERKKNLEELKNEGYQIVFVAKKLRPVMLSSYTEKNPKIVYAQDATVLDVENLIEEIPLLKEAKEKGLIEVVDSGSKMKGTDLRKATDEFRALIEGVQKGKAILGAKGEANNFSLDLLDAEHYRFVLVKTPPAQVMAELPYVEGGLIESAERGITPCPYPFIVRVPRGFEVARDYFGMRKTQMSILRFQRARNIIEEIYGGREKVNWQKILEDITKPAKQKEYETLVEYVVTRYPDKAWNLIFDINPNFNILEEYRRFKENLGRKKTISRLFFEWCLYKNSLLRGDKFNEVLSPYQGRYKKTVYYYEYQIERPGLVVENNKIEDTGVIGNFQELKDSNKLFIIEEAKKCNKVHIHSVLLPLRVLKEKLDFGPVFISDFRREYENLKDIVVFMPDRVSELKKAEGLVFSHVGGYFNPPNLWRPFNIDAERNRFNIPEDYENLAGLNDLIDMVINPYIQTLPIYNKGAYLISKDKNLKFFRVNIAQLENISIKIDGKTVIKGKDSFVLNPEVDEEGRLIGDINPDIVMFTSMHPMVGDENDYEDPDQNRSKNYSLVGKFKVGKDRVNIVIFNNKAKVYTRPVYLQTEGVVISLTKKKAWELLKEKLEEEERLKEEVNVEIDILEDIARVTGVNKENIREVVGGLTIIWEKADSKALLNNKGLLEFVKGKEVKKKEFVRYMNILEYRTRRNFDKEGWFNRLSRLTQETQLQRITVRGPRCIWVKTDNYLLIVAVEGRQDTSIGLNFPELVYIAYRELYNLMSSVGKEKEFEREIQSLEILNFDGGSSVGMGFVYEYDGKKVFIPVVVRAPGPSNCKGMERPVPQLVVFKILANSKNKTSSPIHMFYLQQSLKTVQETETQALRELFGLATNEEIENSIRKEYPQINEGLDSLKNAS
ncbi:MAG: hypothetical protein DRP76_02615, partial [Candidatus Omnitrophota bacterium]